MPVNKSRLTIQEEDGSPSGKPVVLKLPNGSLTDNGDGSFSFAGGGSGDVVGPASSVDNNVAVYSGTTGKLLKDTAMLSATTNLVKLTQASKTTGTPNGFLYTGGTHTGLNSAATTDGYFDFTNSKAYTGVDLSGTIMGRLTIDVGTIATDTGGGMGMMLADSALHLNSIPSYAGSVPLFVSTGLLVGSTDFHTNAMSGTALTFIIPGISAGIGDVQDRGGISVLSPGSISLGDTAGTVGEMAGATLKGSTLVATAAKTVTKAAILNLGTGFVAGTNVTITGNYAINYDDDARLPSYFTGDIAVNAIGYGFKVKTGTNGRIGAATLASGTVTVNNTSVTASTKIFTSAVGTGSGDGSLSYTISAGTSFTITSTNASDDRSVDWIMFESI